MGLKTLIVDSGATKADWVLVNDKGEVEIIFQSRGINSITMDIETITQISQDALNNLKIYSDSEKINLIFYGAGCGSTQVCNMIKKMFYRLYKFNYIDIESDLQGAIKATVGDGSGIVAILGTGSNSCMVENGEIKEKIPSLGYILGDEGSGSAIGKRFLNKIYKNTQEFKDLREEFEKETQMNLEIILDLVYKHPSSNTFMASLIPFISKHRGNFKIKDLILQEFIDFFDKNINKYRTNNKSEIFFVGSIAKIFEEELKIVSNVPIHVVSKPIEGLIKYHSKKNGEYI